VERLAMHVDNGDALGFCRRDGTLSGEGAHIASGAGVGGDSNGQVHIRIRRW
jgi:hypothetical protein